MICLTKSDSEFRRKFDQGKLLFTPKDYSRMHTIARVQHICDMSMSFPLRANVKTIVVSEIENFNIKNIIDIVHENTKHVLDDLIFSASIRYQRGMIYPQLIVKIIDGNVDGETAFSNPYELEKTLHIRGESNFNPRRVQALIGAGVEPSFLLNFRDNIHLLRSGENGQPYLQLVELDANNLEGISKLMSLIAAA